MEERIINLLTKYIERKISSDELEEIKTFVIASPKNRELVRTFIQLHKTEIQADFLSCINKDEGWNNVKTRLAARKRKRTIRWTTAIAAAAIIILSATLIYFRNFNKPAMTMTAMMNKNATRLSLKL